MSFRSPVGHTSKGNETAPAIGNHLLERASLLLTFIGKLPRPAIRPSKETAKARVDDQYSGDLPIIIEELYGKSRGHL
ncbi:hypothetical protein FRC20_002031 [Serendipita sp. 405]|nr:hypothetical protein FRC15_002004 [Serendipita sp. 397]KAG8850432.1 hypothetical protein FRC20_002031 [Serendipita sp. 405]